MTRLPNVRAKEIIRALENAGFEVRRQKESHVSLHHPITERTTIVPFHSGEFPRWLLKQIIQDAGLSEQEFRDVL